MNREASHQADFDPVHHEFENVLLEALFACRWKAERHWRVWHRGGAALNRLLARLRREELLVQRVGNVEQVKQILAHV